LLALNPLAKMTVNFNSWNPSKWSFTKYRNGDSFLSVGKIGSADFGDDDLIQSSITNHALFTALKITSDFCAKAKFKIKRRQGDNITYDDQDPLIKLLDNPNFYQSNTDFIKEFIWLKITNGTGIMRPILPSGFNISPETTESIYNLDNSKLKYPTNFKTPMFIDKADEEKFKETQLEYVEGQDKITLEVGELMYFYDITNGITGSLLQSPSRVKAVKPAISNIRLALESQNVMLQTNGREMFAGQGAKGANTGMSTPIEKGDREEIEGKLIHKYGMSAAKVRSIVTNQGVNWQSLHIALKELGLIEATGHNTSIIRSAFQIPETIWKNYAESGDTFENKKEGEIEMIQNVAQPHMNDFVNTLNTFYGYEDTPLVATFDHVDAMQHIEDKKADKFLKISTAFRNLVNAGVSIEEAQEMAANIGITNLKK
jgi:hypothetical protein